MKDVVEVGEEKVEIKLGRTKTDQVAKGSRIKISGASQGGVSVAKILSWFVEKAKLKKEDYLFCKIGKKG